MSELACAEVRELAPDVALGLLTGEDRAAALAHLERCEGCRAEVASLAVAADEVLLAAPEATPPAGFTGGVLARLGSERAAVDGLPAVPAAVAALAPRSPRSRPSRSRRLSLAAVAAAAVAVVVAGIVAVTGPGGPAPVTVASADMRTGRGDVVGEATVSGDDPATVVIDVPGWSEMVERWEDDVPTTDYWLAIETDDGARTLRPVPASLESWTVRVDASAAALASVSVVDDAGRVWCTGRFAA